MTNKTELLPCPFCGGAADKIRSSGDERDGYADYVSYLCSGCGCRRGAAGDSSRGGYADNSQVEALALAAWNSRAAPAEDVRAVGEEPVALDEEFQRAKFILHFNLEGRIYFDSTTKQWLPTRDRIEGFQMAERVLGLWIGWRACAMQRSVVLPERKDYASEDDDWFRGQSKGWNACLDEFARLNKQT